MQPTLAPCLCLHPLDIHLPVMEFVWHPGPICWAPLPWGLCSLLAPLPCPNSTQHAVLRLFHGTQLTHAHTQFIHHTHIPYLHMLCPCHACRSSFGYNTNVWASRSYVRGPPPPAPPPAAQHHTLARPLGQTAVQGGHAPSRVSQGSQACMHTH